MKSIMIHPEEIRNGVANFVIEYRLHTISNPVEGGPSYQRFFRLTEIPIFKADHIQPARTPWHEVYSRDLSATRHFKQRLNEIGKRLRWKGNIRDLCKLSAIMAGAVPVVDAKNCI